MDDTPLNLKVPKPSFANSRSRSAFGFRAMAIPDAGNSQEIDMADDVVDANKMDEDADIANKGKDVDGGKLDMIRPFFNAFTFFART